MPTRVLFLAIVDEDSMVDPARREPRPLRDGLLPSVLGSHPGHGEFHPVALCQYYDGGRFWVTILGHDVGIWTESAFPGAGEFKAMLLGGIKSAMGLAPVCQ